MCWFITRKTMGMYAFSELKCLPTFHSDIKQLRKFNKLQGNKQVRHRAAKIPRTITSNLLYNIILDFLGVFCSIPSYSGDENSHLNAKYGIELARERPWYRFNDVRLQVMWANDVIVVVVEVSPFWGETDSLYGFLVPGFRN